MPAEVINAANTPYMRARVEWGRDKKVQVGAIYHPDADHAKGSPECACDYHDWEGVYVELDRTGCNRMIRALRKARDQAYGQDA